MKGSEARLLVYLQGSDKRFVIPVYQRNYDWKTENCRQLYDDLVQVIKRKRKSHFFGSITSVYNPEGSSMEFRVIDGQQRITTVSLLLLSMYNLLDKGIVETDNPYLKKKLMEDYLIDQYSPLDTRIKLKSVKNDRIAYEKLFDDPADYIPNSGLTINYNYFYDRIQRKEININQLFDAISRLEIISITLNTDDDPQLIFDSLNSTGVALSEGDRIRNFILMGLPSKQQESYYKKYWNKIEECTNYDPSTFIRDYLSVKTQLISPQKKVYITFKEYVEDLSIKTEELLSDMVNYARWFKQINTADTKEKKLNACIYRLNRLETTVTRPFFLEVMRLNSEGNLDLQQVTEIFEYTENYLFRRTICDLPTNALNKIFLSLHKEIMRYDGTVNNYVDKFKYVISSKKERTRFPDDEEFKIAFSERQVFLMNSKNKIYILERLENYGTDEDKDIYRHYDAGDYSIEHIMPQHLTPSWVTSLGDDYEQIHNTWIHRIANLTLTAYNSKYSNSSFDDKKNMANGFTDSGIRLNSFISQKDKWTLAELEERDQYLTNHAVNIWSMPTSTFKPAAKVMDSFTLEDDENLSGKQIAKFSFKSIERPVNSWVDMYGAVVKILHDEDKSVLSRLAYESSRVEDAAAYVSHKEEDLRAALEIEPGLYIERNNSTQAKLYILRKLFALYDADQTDLVFYTRDESTPQDEENVKSSNKRKFWIYAIPIIQKANFDTGLFKNVGPTKGNWISGFFGVGGFNISCVASSEGARVEVVLARSRKEDNEKAFMALKEKKDTIQGKLGIELTWFSEANVKSSKISYSLKNVSIKNESDWREMAEFHAEWSKKFMDIIVPYIQSINA